MKILTISTVSYANNGITNVILNYFYRINKIHQMDFIFLSKPYSEFIESCKKKHSKFYVLPERLSNPLKYIKKLSEIIKLNDYDIVHVHGNSSTMLLELLVCKNVNIKNVVVHGHSTSTKYPLIHRTLNPFFNYLAKNKLAASDMSGRWLYKNEDFIIMPNGIPVEQFKFNRKKREKLRDILNIGENDFVIGHVGRLDENKNQSYLIDLINELNDSRYRLVLIGEGTAREALEKKTESYNISNQVIMLGNQSNVNEWLNVFDVFIFPSISEGLGLVLIEAQANGLKCLVSDTVPDEVNVTGTIHFFNLAEDFKTITKTLKKTAKSDYRNSQQLMFNDIKNSVFNIDNSIKILENFYSDIMGENCGRKTFD